MKLSHRVFACGLALVFGLTVANAQAVPVAHLRTIYLVRHGQAETGGKGDETAVNGLTTLGLAQAKLIGSRLRGMPVAFTSLTTSTLLRARQTAAIIHESLPQLELEFTPLLRERTPRTWQADAIKDVPDGELDAAEAQLNEAFARYFRPAEGADSNDVLVCHGNVIRYFVTKALGVDTKAWLGMGLANCSLTIIQVRPNGSCKVLAVGDTGHIPPTLLSGWSRPEPQLVAPSVEMPAGSGKR